MRSLPEQEAIRANCFHPSGTFVESSKADVETSIPEQFEKIVCQYPENLALKKGTRSLTYSQLNEAANQIAREILNRHGLKSEPIALLFDHGINVIVAILAVLKAGKFYVAMDFSLSKATIQYILQSSTAALVITDSCEAGRARETIGPERDLLSLDDVDISLPANNLGLPLTADDLAALIYTSGSTGNPKGVLHTHRSYVLGVLESPAHQGISSDDRLSLLHSVSFKSATSHLVFSLMGGACLLPYDIKTQGLHGFADWLRDERITRCHLPPAVFQAFADDLNNINQFPDLKRICLSGSVVTSAAFERFRRKIGGTTQLEVAMGCTEVGWATSGIAEVGYVFPKEGNPIGYPVGGKKILILDDEGGEVPQGKLGEIAVKSRYLSPGYWQDPKLTQAKFLPDPDGGPERTYLTGDLGRMLADGSLVHIGRKDLMVKIRGHGVEVEGVERKLNEHPQVKDAAVSAWDYGDGDKYLAAYIVAEGKSLPTADQLKTFLRETLPDYMIPSTIMFLDSLPLTNGKLDRKALPQPGNTRPELRTKYYIPRNEIEKCLVRIWEDLLDVHPIGIHDNFFDLGGHSLSSARVVSRVFEQYQLEIPLQSLFQAPTIAEMAAVIAEHQAKKLDESQFAAILDELASMSDLEAEQRVSENNYTTTKKADGPS